MTKGKREVSSGSFEAEESLGYDAHDLAREALEFYDGKDRRPGEIDESELLDLGSLQREMQTRRPDFPEDATDFGEL